MTDLKEIELKLIEEAIQAREHAYAPYSGYLVGAALLSESGRIYGGCNVENAAYGPSNCAERTAFFKAVSAGEQKFSAIAIVGAKQGEKITEFAPPCGVCRQVMAEFCSPDQFRIIVAKSTEAYYVKTLAEFLPESFGSAHIK